MCENSASKPQPYGTLVQHTRVFLKSHLTLFAHQNMGGALAYVYAKSLLIITCKCIILSYKIIGNLPSEQSKTA